MKKLYRKLMSLLKPCYVIIYDMPTGPFGDDEMAEEYYGYFSSVEEARAVWDTYSDGEPYENVKLCKVVQSW